MSLFRSIIWWWNISSNTSKMQLWLCPGTGTISSITCENYLYVVSFSHENIFTVIRRNFLLDSYHEWSLDEIQRFEEGLQEYRKDFHKICVNKVKFIKIHKWNKELLFLLSFVQLVSWSNGTRNCSFLLWMEENWTISNIYWRTTATSQCYEFSNVSVNMDLWKLTGIFVVSSEIWLKNLSKNKNSSYVQPLE